MRNLTINKRKVVFKKREIKYEVEKVQNLSDNNVTTFRFVSEEPHGLQDGDKVVLEKSFDRTRYTDREKRHKYVNTTTRIYEINIIDGITFDIEFLNYEMVIVRNYANRESNAILDIISKSMYECVNDVDIFTIKTMGKEYTGKIGIIRHPETGEIINATDARAQCIIFDEPLPHIVGEGNVFVKNTWHLSEENDKFNSGEFNTNDIRIYDETPYMSTAVPLSIAASYKLDDERMVNNMVNDIINDVVPEIIDNEKRQFSPMIKQGSTLKLAQEIEFNIHFRERYDLDASTNVKKVMSETWSTTDEQIWNGFEIDKKTNCLKRVYDGFDDDYGDELDVLGFTEDDIRFKKTKLKKSFLRLSFYSSKNLLDKELLYYSTIFFDTGELYSIYSNIKNYKKNSNSQNVNPAFNKTNTNKSLRLSAKFTLHNKFNTTKSSEGFYLYLFPNEVEGENKPRTIYMKVEFNHAGYGKTVAMMLPRERYERIGYDENTKEPLYGKNIVYNDNFPPLESSSTDFPLTFLKEVDGLVDNDYERYTNSVMIPVNIIYDTRTKSYAYYFPWFNRANENKITINLWEPRIRG